ncbi:MAG: hypothetical protein KAH22_01195 [Thiotrichaceae bacterium]|nr:hypothetical protein [Thiotrichaceae bacterium]
MENSPLISISQHVANFKNTKNPYHLLKAIALLIKRGRVHELLYGFYCQVMHPPNQVFHDDEISTLVIKVIDENINHYKREFISYQQLLDLYGQRFAIKALPKDFAGTRSESIVIIGEQCLVGEYGMDNNSARLFVIDKKSCSINLKYSHTAGVRHLHAIHAKNNQEIVITTGDRLKMLDAWTLHKGVLTFDKRIKRYLTGYTGITKVANKLYFGTDFSARPNYIETEQGEKFFFPEKAYRQFVMSFHSFQDRYILAFNSHLDEFGMSKTLSIFDTETRQFVYCDVIQLPD